MYVKRMQRNLRRVITKHGVELNAQDSTLNSISARHLWNVERGLAKVTLNVLENIADEIGADFMEFFEE